MIETQQKIHLHELTRDQVCGPHRQSEGNRVRRIKKTKNRERTADRGGDEDSNSVIETGRWKLLLFF